MVRDDFIPISEVYTLSVLIDYLVVVRNSLATYDEQCNDVTSSTIKIMQDMITSSTGRTALQKAFR